MLDGKICTVQGAEIPPPSVCIDGLSREKSGLVLHNQSVPHLSLETNIAQQFLPCNSDFSQSTVLRTVKTIELQLNQ